MSVRATDDGGIRHVGQCYVVDKGAAATQKPVVFNAF